MRYLVCIFVSIFKFTLAMKAKLIVLFCFFSFIYSKAQSDINLSFGFYNPVISDTAYMQGILGLSANIVNNGEDTIFWPLNLMYEVNNSIDLVSGGVLTEEDVSFLIAPGDSLHIGWPILDTSNSEFNGGYININEQNGFYDGDNIIVVWPAIFWPDSVDDGTTITVEQYVHQVHIINNISNVETHSRKADFKMFLSSDSKLKVEGLAKEIERLDVYDLSAKKLFSQPNSNVIDIQPFAKGIYVLVVAFEDGIEQSTKVYFPY